MSPIPFNSFTASCLAFSSWFTKALCKEGLLIRISLFALVSLSLVSNSLTALDKVACLLTCSVSVSSSPINLLLIASTSLMFLWISSLVKVLVSSIKLVNLRLTTSLGLKLSLSRLVNSSSVKWDTSWELSNSTSWLSLFVLLVFFLRGPAIAPTAPGSDIAVPPKEPRAAPKATLAKSTSPVAA